jgi:hypothetical protein
MSDVTERLERFAKEGAGVAVLIDAASEIKQLREALDNSQSLLTMVLHLGQSYQAATIGRIASGITTTEWDGENLTKLLTDQITENRAVLR